MKRVSIMAVIMVALLATVLLLCESYRNDIVPRPTEDSITSTATEISQSVVNGNSLVP
jgi:hypothetical protein